MVTLKRKLASGGGEKRNEKNGGHLFRFESSDNLHFWICFSIITILAFATRFYKISEPDHVCWDETHFGKMGSWYINRTFFFDVHPPLGKMLIGLSGYLSGYDGTFPFTKPGDKYHDANYVGMRIFCAILGTLLVPFSFLICWDFTKSLSSSILGSAFLLFDVGLITLSQYILLDPILLCFIFAAFLGSSKICQSLYQEPFSPSWWFWMTWTGFFLGSSVGVKFVGLFIVAVVGIQTVFDLWRLLGDLTLTVRDLLNHLAARVVCLILVPIALYVAFFWIHLLVLSKSGSGDGFFSSAFQSQLEGNSLFNASMPRFVAYGSVITLKNTRTGGGYLHSHWHLYPEGVGARQQQVTGYSHKDENNKWLIKRFDSDPKAEDSVQLVRDGQLVRLEHLATGRNLHSHREPAPVTKRHFQVTGYGENGTGDANDVWRLHLIHEPPNETVKTVTSKIRLIHYFAKCALTCNSKQLPKWGFEQMEVTCDPNTLDSGSVWNIEDNLFPKLPNVSFQLYAPSFLSRFIESHAVMFQGNSGLKPKEGEVTSRPWHWPINLRGQFFSGNRYKIYLLGNPVIWWLNFTLILAFFILTPALLIYRQRKSGLRSETSHRKNEQLDTNESNYLIRNLINAGFWFFLAWFIHYVPFYAMGRVLYYHHYFPASVFSSLLSAVLIDLTLNILAMFSAMFLHTKSNTIVYSGICVTIAILSKSFIDFSPLAYGIIDSNEGNETSATSPLEHLRWLESWEF